MLRYLLLSLLVWVICLARVNYRITRKIIPRNVKNQILAKKNSDAAFEAFLEAYDDIEPEDFVLQASPEARRGQRNRQKATFKKNFREIKRHNKRYSRGEVSYGMEVNSFAGMDDENRRMFLGFGENSVSGDLQLRQYGKPPRPHPGFFNNTRTSTSSSREKGPLRAPAASKDWKSDLGPVKDQSGCGSCWTYPATALLEFAIRQATNEKIPLSEQQLLDCTYERRTNRDGCNGGFYDEAWKDIIANGNRLARESDYRYENRDARCRVDEHRNALANRIRLERYFAVPAENVLEQMQMSPLAVAIHVERSTFGMGDGVYDGCSGDHSYIPNHAVTMTGYGEGYWEIRNSWGSNWNNGGYIQIKRSGTKSVCGLLGWAYAIETTRIAADSTGTPTTSASSATTATVEPTDPNPVENVRYNVIYTIASRSYGHSKTEDPQFVKIKGSRGVTEEVHCKADFYVYDQDVACTFESNVDIGDYRCLFLRTGGDDALRVKKVTVEINGREKDVVLPPGNDKYIKLDDGETKRFCSVDDGESDSGEVQYKVIYTIADRSVRHAKSEDPQYVMIKGSGGDTMETLCKANFDVYGQNVACTFWSDTDIGDFRCVVLRTGGDDALRLTKVTVEKNGREIHEVLPPNGDDYISLDDRETLEFC